MSKLSERIKRLAIKAGMPIRSKSLTKSEVEELRAWARDQRTFRPGKKMNPTKSQRRAKASRAAKQRGIIKAVRGLLKKTNPSAKITGARVVKLRDGVLKITPIKANRGCR